MSTLKSKQPNISQQLIRMLVERILAEVLPDETGATRLQQVGLFTLIYMMQGDDEPVTASRIQAMTGQSQGQVGLLLKKLIDVGLIERTQILNRQGRGRAFALSIKHTSKTKRLLAAIDNATKGKKG
jgi:DNA-binding transcriptional ArsR family regulator